jgi:tight adherence protein C
VDAGLIAFFTFLAVFTAFYARFAPNNPVTFADPIRPDGKEDGLFEKWVRPSLRNFAPSAPPALAKYAKGSEGIATLLRRSGNPWNVSPEEYLFMRILSGILVAAGISLYASLGLLPLPIPPLLLFVGGFAFGAFIPQALLSSAWGKRKKDLNRTLPEALDLMRICLNAGFNFPNALSEVVTLLPDGTTKEELRRTQADLRSGRTVAQAMEDFAFRCPTEQVEAFVRAVNISQSMGTDMASTLASQADEARLAYERLVDVKAQKLQTTLFLPIIVFFLPVLLIVIFGPSFADLGNI